jgi:hypothetical protein
MKIAAYTWSSGLEDHSFISSTTRSVIRLIVSFETDAPYISWKCTLISPVVKPFAYRESTTSSTSFKRRCRFLTITGSNEASRSRGTVISTGPTASVVTVLLVVPLRAFFARPSNVFSCLTRPRCSFISSSNAVSSTVLVNCFNRPPGPVNASPCSLAWRTSCTAASISAERVWFSLFLAVIPAIVSVGILTGLPRQSTRSAIKASYTHKWTVPTHTHTNTDVDWFLFPVSYWATSVALV